MTKSGKHCGKRSSCTFCAISSCHYILKKLSAAEASESVYMRERVNEYVYSESSGEPLHPKRLSRVFNVCLNVKYAYTHPLSNENYKPSSYRQFNLTL